MKAPRLACYTLAMHRLKTKLINGPHAQSIDKWGNFARYLLKRFIDDRCFELAGSLSYTSMLAIVPFAAVVFAVLTAFPIFDQWTSQLTDFVFNNFVPGVAYNLEQNLRNFASSARTLPAKGIVALLVTVGLTMWSVEKAFNRIWRVPSPKPKLIRFLVYWGMLTVGSLLAVSMLAVNSALSVYFNFAEFTPSFLNGFGLMLAPILLEVVIFTGAYWLIPHSVVQFRFALAGGLLATLMFELLKFLFAIYLKSVSFQHIYGALAVIPIALVWLYFVWLVILLCASITATLSSFRYRPKAFRVAKGNDFFWVLRLIVRFIDADYEKNHLSFETLAKLEPNISEPMLRLYLNGMSKINLIQSDNHDCWWLESPLKEITLKDLHQGLGLRIPMDANTIPTHGDHVDERVIPILAMLRKTLSESLERPLSTCFTHV
jgi:membrane protein